MGITYMEQERLFWLDTKHTSYVIGIVDEENYIGHVYYGSRLRKQDVSCLMRTGEAPFVPSKNDRDKVSFLDAFPMEYPGNNLGDYRDSAIAVRTMQGHIGVSLQYDSYEIVSGKPALEGLPATFGRKEECQTLIIHCMDNAIGLQADLLYTQFYECDVITRSVRIRNVESEPIYLTKVMSACIDMDNQDYEMISLHGSWARERQIEYRSIGHGRQNVASTRGESSHQEHPFIAVKGKNTTQDTGEVYGMHFVYSGNFLGQVERNQFDSIRMMMGIHPDNFSWKLMPQETFQAPEVVLTYSNQGLGQMTRNLHDLYREHLIRSAYVHKSRPVLINNWEATYFDFDEKKLLSIAKEASSLGIEMLVLDDGWFGHRQDDNSSLGDWYVNEEKIRGGLLKLVEEVNALGMKFGIWFEPEMVSPDSKLYQEHPDWAIAIPGRRASLCRNQYVLDLSRKEVRDYVYECVASILRSANITYVKWDMNRQLSDLGSAVLDIDCQGELSHRYMLGVYELQERLLAEFPELLLENCSGGGARFDPGMLYYSPQIWCSDDTDAIERLRIQEGTALIYPLSAMGAHVSDCPNHTVGRVTPFWARGDVALAGTFGYELDVTKIAKEERALIPEQIAVYKKYNELIRDGDYYRLESYTFNHEKDAYMVVSKDKKEALITYVQVLRQANCHSAKLKLGGLCETYDYAVEMEHVAEDNTKNKTQVYGGDFLMHAGLLIEPLWGDYQSQLIHLYQR